jgi:2-hydroxy-3-oxopropionate reductase
MTKPTVGFIGIGIMGEPMAHHLLKAGYPLRVWNRTPGKLHSLVAAGAAPCAQAHEAAQGVSSLICMLSGDSTCNDVLFGDDGVVAAMAPDATLVMMSSIAVETAIDQAKQAAEYGVRYLDAPVSGGQTGARNATLAIMVGGGEEDFATTAPLLAHLGRRFCLRNAEERIRKKYAKLWLEDLPTPRFCNNTQNA